MNRQKPDGKPAWHRYAWFIGLWVAGVVALLLIAGVIRLLLPG